MLLTICEFLLKDVELDYYKWHYENLYKEKFYNALIIGNSLAVHGIRPSILDTSDFKYFNYGLNGASSNFYLKWYKNHLAEIDSIPEYLIICTPMTGWRRYEHDAAFFPFTLFVSNLFSPREYSRQVLINSRFNLMKFSTGISRSKKKIEKKLFDFGDYDKGYISFKGSPVDFKFFQPYTEKESKNMLVAMEELVSLARIKGSKIILVSIPVLEQTEGRTNLNGYTVKFAQKLNIPHINYLKDSLVLERIRKPEYYSDNSHLNAKGSHLFSRILKQDINKLILPEE